MRILVTGASGFIGRTYLNVLDGDEVLGTFHNHPQPGLLHLDLLDSEETRKRVYESRPDAIIHCAARPSVDWCEQNPEAARQLNYVATLNVLEAARRVSARVAFMSTDYVFDGVSGPYLEDDPTRPINTYGRLKLEAERAIVGDSDRHVVARTTNVYGFDPRSKNFLMAILPQIARGERLTVASDQYGTPTLVTDLCRIVRALLGRGVGGVFHVAGPDYLNRVEWARAAAVAFGLAAEVVHGAATAALDQAAPRPLKAGLSSTRLRSEGIEGPRSLSDGLRLMTEEKRRSPVQPW